MKRIKILVRYAGLLAEIVGKSYEYLEVPEGTSIKALVVMLAQSNVNFKNWLEALPLIQIFVNGAEVTGLDRYLEDGDEVVLMPPLYEGG